MPFSRSATFIAFFLFCAPIFAQQTSIFTEAEKHYKNGVDLFEKGIYAPAQSEFQKAYDIIRPVQDESAQMLHAQAKLYFAKCAVRLNQPDGEKLVLDFTRKIDPDPVAVEATLEMGDFYYNAKEYEKAIALYSQVNPSDLSKNRRANLKFQLGYSYFIRKKFNEAKAIFGDIKDDENRYYYPSNYYYGMIMFFENRHDEAITSFNKVKPSKKYGNHVPYYIGQIYFAQGEYNKLITYTQPLASKPNITKKTEMHQLIGQAYFEMGDYDEALHYLQYFVDNSSKIRAEDYYQLGYTLYQKGAYLKAIESLEKLNTADSKLGQHAMYILADAHLKNNNRVSAKNAFYNASKLDFDKDIKNESLFNYAKLSYELDADREAITALQNFDSNSKYHLEAQSILSSIFINTTDYEGTMKVIESMPNKSPKMQETLQTIIYNRGLQLLKDGNVKRAKEMFNKSLENPINNRTKALTLYWLGDIAHNADKYDTSIRNLDKFIALAKTLPQLPDESSLYTANYTQGYNYLKQKDYVSALTYFKTVIKGIEKNRNYITDTNVSNKILGDAILRAGDCLFKRNKYKEAVKLYDSAIGNRFEGYEYALYQKGILEGLQDNNEKKISALNELTTKFPNSKYADDALLQLGITYQSIDKQDQAVKALNKLTQNYMGKSDLVNRALIQLGLINFNNEEMNIAITNYKSVFSNNPEPDEANAALLALEEIYVDRLSQPNEYLAFRESIPGYKVGTEEKDNLNFKSAESKYENANYSEAIEPLSDYINKFPDGRNLIKAYFYRADCFVIGENYNSAFADYENVIRKGPSKYYEKALRNAALIAYNQKKDFIKSFQLYSKLQQVATTDEQKFEAALGAIRSAYRSKNAEAVYTLADAINKETNATDENKVEASYYAGKMAYDQKKYDPAIEYFNKVIRKTKDERSAEGMYTISHIYYLKKELDFAKTLTEKTMKESRPYPNWIARSFILYADIASEQGDDLNARSSLEVLLEQAAKDPADFDPELIRIAKEKLAKLDEKEATNKLIQPIAPDADLEMEEIDANGNRME